MESYQSSSAKVRTHCQVCLNDESLKLLDCEHSCCIACLSGLAEAHEATALKVSCLKCKSETVIKSGNLSDLPDNIQLYEETATVHKQNRHCNCFYCMKLEKEAMAVGQCITCHRFMCEGCAEKHKNLLSRHQVVLMMDDKQQEFCHKHNEPVVYVCRVCSPLRLLCDICIMVDGQCHSEKELVEYTDFMEEETKLKSKLDQLSNLDVVLKELEVRRQMDVTRILDVVKREVASPIEDSLNINSIKLATETVKQTSAMAHELLNCDARQLDGLQKANRQMQKAFNEFNREKKKAKAIDPTLDLESELKEPLSSLKQVLSSILAAGPTFVVTNLPKKAHHK